MVSPRLTDGDTLPEKAQKLLRSDRKIQKRSGTRPEKFRNDPGAVKWPKMANARFTNGGTLHAMSLTSPLLNPGYAARILFLPKKLRNCFGAPEKVLKRSGTRPKKCRNGPGAVQTAQKWPTLGLPTGVRCTQCLRPPRS